MKQDERARFVQALQQARVTAYAPGDFVEQESFMRAAEIRALAERAGIAPGVTVVDLCCGVAGPGRFITRELGCTYLGVDSSSSALEIARERAGDLPCRFRARANTSNPSRPVRRGAPARDHARLSRQGDAARRDNAGAQARRAVRLHSLEEGLPLTEAERERMPDADTVWLIPLSEMLAYLERAGLRVRWREDVSRSHPHRGRFLAECVRRRCDGHRGADRACGTRRPAGRPPALERVAAGGRVRKFAFVAERT